MNALIYIYKATLKGTVS